MEKGPIAVGALVVAIISLGLSVYSIQQSGEFFTLQSKRDVLRRYMGYAGRLTEKDTHNLFRYNGKEPFIALNEARAVFADNEEIIDLLQELSGSKKQSEIHVKLMRAMGKAAGFDLSEWPDEFLLTPFTPNPSDRILEAGQP